MLFSASVWRGKKKAVGDKVSSAQSPVISGRTGVFFQVFTAMLHIIHLIMIIVYNLHNSDNCHMQLHILNCSLVLEQISFVGIRRLVFHVPVYLPLHNLTAICQSPTSDKRKGDAPMSEYADSRLTVVPQLSRT